MEMQTTQAESVPSTEEQPNSLEGMEQPPVVVHCSAGDDKIDPFLLSALNNPRDRLLLLKLDHELERFVNDTSKQRLEFPPMSSYQRLIVHRVAQYFLLDHAAVDVDNLKRAVVLFKSPQSRIPILRLTDLREEPDAPPQKAVKIMRRAPNVNGRYNSSLSGGAGEKAQLDKTLEERESEYAKARARIFNEGTGDKSNSNISNENTSSPSEDESKTDKVINNINTSKDSLTSSTPDSNTNTPPIPQKRNPINNPPTKTRRNIQDGPKYGNDPTAFSDSSFYSQDPYRDKLVYNAKDHLDGDIKDRMHPYPIGHFDPDGLFPNGLGLGLGMGMDGYPPIRFDGYDNNFDYPAAQEVPPAWGLPQHPSHPLPPHLHPHNPPFYGFSGGARYGDMANGKGETSFYYDYVPSAKEPEWTPPSMLSLNAPLSANATPFEPASHSQNHGNTTSTPSSNPSTSSTPTPSSSNSGGPNIMNTNNTINNFNTINTFNTINNINTINIINNNNNGNNAKSPTPSSALSSSTLPSRNPSTSPPFQNISVPPVTNSTRPLVAKTLSSSSIPTTPASSSSSSQALSSNSSPAIVRGNLSRSATSPPSTSPPPSSIPSSSSVPSALSSIGAFPRTTSPPATSPPPSLSPSGAQQLPPPTQIPMQPPPIYRNNNNNNSNMPMFGFEGAPNYMHHPYMAPFPTASLPHHPQFLYPPPHPQFLPHSQNGAFVGGPGGPIYHPFMGPAPMQKPVASLDYERRPPKSTELFDPKAPAPPKRQSGTQQLEAGMRQMNLYPAPNNSPAQTHNSLTNQQGVKKNNPLSNSSSSTSSSSLLSSKAPSTKVSQQSPPQALQPKNSLSSSSSSSALSPTPSLASSSSSKQKLSSSGSSTSVSQVSPPFQQTQQFSSSIPQDQTGPRLLYEYPQQQGVYVPPDLTPPPTVSHILEIFDFATPPSSVDNPIFTDLRKAGASIKVLDSSVFIAIFRNGNAAKKALESWERENINGGYKLRQWMPALISGVVPTDNDPNI